MKCDGARAETRFSLSSQRTSSFKSAGASVQSTTGSRVVRISGSNGSNAGHTMFRGSVKGTGLPTTFASSPPHFPTRPSPCAITFQLESTANVLVRVGLADNATVLVRRVRFWGRRVVPFGT